MLHPQELTKECLVCGAEPSERDEEPSVESIRAEAVRLAEQLRAAGDGRWPRRLEAAAARNDLYDLGHYLYLLRRDRCVDIDSDALSRLMFAVGMTLSPDAVHPS
jgi:hypothetical protein